MNDSDEEIFRRLTEDLDIDPVLLSQSSAPSLSDLDLLRRFSETKRELYAISEVTHPRTQKGRDLHAEYHACLYELKKRRLM